MSIIPIKKSDELSEGLYEDIQSASDHELELAIGAHKPPILPSRDIHPAVVGLPGRSDSEYLALKEDIRRNGQQRAISMYQGMIWDGRARYSACIELGLVPRVWIVRRKAVSHLLQRNYSRFGEPHSTERKVLVDVYLFLTGEEWKKREQQQRSDWVKYARWKFQLASRERSLCEICGMHDGYSHAHHSLPLNIQYDLGISEPVDDHDWLCPTHHQFIHKAISAILLGTRRVGREAIFKFDPSLKDDRQRQAARLLFEKAERLFAAVGGIIPGGSWGLLLP